MFTILFHGATHRVAPTKQHSLCGLYIPCGYVTKKEGEEGVINLAPTKSYFRRGKGEHLTP